MFSGVMSGYNLLHLEDNACDAELVAAHLKKEGRTDRITLVQTAESFQKEISTGQYVALLCDYSIPGYDVLSAIEYAKKAGIPTLIVSGSIGEEKAVEIIKNGAFDYISKSQLTKLSTSIDRAIEETQKSREYKELQHLYQTLVESSHALILKMNPQGEILYQNDRLSQHADLKAKSWLDLFEPTERKQFQSALEKCSALKRPFQKEGHLVSGIWVNSHFTPILNDQHEISSWIGLLVDISHLKKAEEESRFKSLFLAQMSHELRTPLTTILGYCDFLYDEIQEKLEKDSSVKNWFSYLEKIKISGEYLLGMLSNLLNLSEIEAGKITLTRSYFSIFAFCEKLIEIWKPSFQKRNLKLEYRIDHDLPSLIFTDQIRLQQVLMNLFSNAAKYTEESRSIRFIVEKDDEWIVFAVANEGEPLLDEERKHIFEPFNRGMNPTRSQTPGLGLGLLIAKILSESLGGRIEVDCQKGWINFRVHVPLQPENQG